MTAALIVLFATAAAGFVNGVSGFGFGIVVMIFLPIFLSITDAAFLSLFTSTFMCITMVLKYREHIQWKKIWLPVLINIPMTMLFLRLIAGMNVASLKPWLGVLLICLSLWFILFAGKVKVKATPSTAVGLTLLGSAGDAAFGIGGPPMVVYFLSACEEKEQYLGSIQCYFLCCNIFNVGTRLLTGMVSDVSAILPLAAASFCGMLIGVTAGGKVVARLNTEQIKKIVYVFIGVAGVITLITSLMK